MPKSSKKANELKARMWREAIIGTEDEAALFATLDVITMSDHPISIDEAVAKGREIAKQARSGGAGTPSPSTREE